MFLLEMQDCTDLPLRFRMQPFRRNRLRLYPKRPNFRLHTVRQKQMHLFLKALPERQNHLNHLKILLR